MYLTINILLNIKKIEDVVKHISYSYQKTCKLHFKLDMHSNHTYNPFLIIWKEWFKK